MLYNSYGPWRGCQNVFVGYYNDYADPDLVWNGYTFNYWDIEDALWQNFLEETGFTDSDSGVELLERKFNRYVQENAVDYLKDCIASGYFAEEETSWHERYSIKEEAKEETA